MTEILIWAIALVLMLAGLVWMFFNRRNRVMLADEEQGVRRSLQLAQWLGDGAKENFRSMQLTNLYIAQEKNGRNLPRSAVVFGIGLLIFAAQVTRLYLF